MKWDDILFEWQGIYGIFRRIVIILGAALVIVFFIQVLDVTAGTNPTVYRNIETVNPCAPAAYAPIPHNAPAPCIRPAYFFDKFSKLFLGLMVLIIAICLTNNLPVYDKDDPQSKRTDIYIPVILSRSEAILIIVACWLLGLPLNYFLLNIPFLEYTQLWLFLAISGYIGSWVLVIFFLVMENLGKRTTRAMSPFNVTLTNLDATQVIALMGAPLKIINIESKMIYIYKNAKVIFTEGKVSDVQ